jgi:hypothetical protein
LPPSLMTSELGSFARRTIVERKPQIIRQVIEDNDYTLGVVQALETFRDEIASQPMRPLSEHAPDVAFWNRELAAYRDKTWLEVPWYFAETYFYRRLLEAVRYFQPGPWEGRDPYGPRVLGLGRRVGSGHRGAGRRAVGRCRSGDLLRRVRTLPTWASQSLPQHSLLRHTANQRRFRRVHHHACRELLSLAAGIRARGGRDARTGA